MSDTVVADNRQLRAELASLLQQAQRNQQIMHRNQAFDLKLIGATGLQDLVERIFDTLSESSQLDVVTVALIDGDYAIRRVMADLMMDLTEFPNLLMVDQAEELGSALALVEKPVLGRFSAALHGAIFPAQVLTPVSIAIVPLRCQDRLIGYLNLGSLQDERFSGNLATDFLEHLGRIIAICLENVINNERLKRIGLTDSLTGVHNRRYLETRLLEEISRSARQAARLACLYIDIDHFKQINDQHGHHAGDEVLQEVAACIKAELRLSDALGRFGGEEFVVLLTDTAADESLAVAERIRCRVAQTLVTLSEGDQVAVTVSIGISTLRADEAAMPATLVASRLIVRADKALYQAKAKGRNRVLTHSEVAN